MTKSWTTKIRKRQRNTGPTMITPLFRAWIGEEEQVHVIRSRAKKPPEIRAENPVWSDLRLGRFTASRVRERVTSPWGTDVEASPDSTCETP